MKIKEVDLKSGNGKLNPSLRYLVITNLFYDHGVWHSLMSDDRGRQRT